MSVREQVQRLEEMLQMWEEEILLLDLSQDLLVQQWGGENGAPRLVAAFNDDLRKHLLSVYASQQDEFEVPGRFARLTVGQPDDSVRAFNIFILFLIAWTAQSRRVYKLPRDMQYLLTNTSMGEVSWDMVKLPFGTFTICLEEPIVCGLNTYDCFLVSHFNSERIHILACGPNKTPWKPMGDFQLSQIRRYYRGRQWEKLRNAILDRNAFKQGSRLFLTYLTAPEGPVPVEETGGRLEEALEDAGKTGVFSFVNEIQSIYRLVAGLCLYLTSLPGGTTQVANVQPAGREVKTFDRTAVTSTTEVMTVANFYTLKGEKEELLRLVDMSRRGEVCCHWRKGHWRRPRGTGHIEGAPATQWIEPVLVRADRLPEGGVPAGTKVTVKKSRS